jgi:hypothetical protein
MFRLEHVCSKWRRSRRRVRLTHDAAEQSATFREFLSKRIQAKSMPLCDAQTAAAADFLPFK